MSRFVPNHAVALARVLQKFVGWLISEENSMVTVHVASGSGSDSDEQW